MYRGFTLKVFSVFVLFFIAANTWGYDGYLFDAMAQIDERVDMDEAMRKVKKAGVDKIALFARSRRYLRENETKLLGLRDDYSNLIVLGAPKYFLMRGDLDNDFIEATVNGISRSHYLFVGEILYTHGDKSHGEQTDRGERYIDPLNKGTEKLLSRLERLKIPIMTHWEVYAWDRDWPRFSQIYASHPKIKFIIPHMAFGSASQVDSILSRHPNVYMTLSKKLKKKGGYSDSLKQSRLGSPILDKNKVLRDEWKAILTQYQDRILFATDAHKPHRWKKYHKLVKRYHKLADQLPEKIAKKISYLNAEILYGVKIK